MDNLNSVPIVKWSYKCSKGHHWGCDVSFNAPTGINLNFGGDLALKGLCPYCLKEWIETNLANVGRVEVDNERS